MSTSPQESHRISYLLSLIDTLTEWEQEFVTSISEYPTERSLTEKEREKLAEIYANY